VGIAIIECRTRPSRFRRVRSLPVLLAVLAAHALIPSAYAQESVIGLDAAQTRIDFTLSDVLHTVHGMFKLKSGAIRFDPSTGKASGAIVVDATSGESGNGTRDAKMHREILESGKFMEIVFTPDQVKGALSPQGSSRMEVSGQFHMHGQDHELTLPMDVQADGRQLQLTARFIIPYVQWGLKNPSTFLLRVSDKVTIDIQAVGHLEVPR
jgi:polyisoprenoid-binding protein YceI